MLKRKPMEERLSRRLPVAMTEEMFLALVDWANREHTTLVALIRRSLVEAFDRQGIPFSENELGGKRDE